ncbi:MAG: hypothetical protein Q3M30_11755 [Candidatus Electrothrix sp. Rat3]|nr:hypothetical protein [Candidatus Electrothrix rattekaaiensis]
MKFCSKDRYCFINVSDDLHLFILPEEITMESFSPDEFVSNCLKDGKIQVPCIEGHIFDPDTYRGTAKWLIQAIDGKIQRVNKQIVEQQRIQQQSRGGKEDRIRVEAAVAKNKALDRSSQLGWDMPQPFAIAQGEAAKNKVLDQLKNINIPSAKSFLEVDSYHYEICTANKRLIDIQHTSLRYIVALVKFFKENNYRTELKQTVKKQSEKFKNVRFESLKEMPPLHNNDDKYELIVADQIKMMLENNG